MVCAFCGRGVRKVRTRFSSRRRAICDACPPSHTASSWRHNPLDEQPITGPDDGCPCSSAARTSARSQGSYPPRDIHLATNACVLCGDIVGDKLAATGPRAAAIPLPGSRSGAGRWMPGGKTDLGLMSADAAFRPGKVLERESCSCGSWRSSGAPRIHEGASCRG